jgi:Dyp-type peroxidase family
MPIDLDLPASQVDLGSSAYANLRKNLQGNIIKSLGRPRQHHIFLEFTGTTAAIKTWIKTHIAPKVITAEAQRLQSANPGVDGGLAVNFFLSSAGYQKLGLAIDGFASKAFRRGMKVEGSSGKDPKPATWEAGFQGGVHAMVGFADASITPINAAVTALKATLANVAKVLTEQSGHALKTPDGVNREHFGYADGISNPFFDKSGKTNSTRADPDWNDGAPLNLVLTLDPFAKSTADAYGSYFVYRKLGQNVGQFDDRVLQLAASLAVSADLAGAYAVGRFRDGTPVVDRDVPTGPTLENGFDYDDAVHRARCPAHAHIRKANPRGRVPLVNESKKRIVRRGIPYGDPIFPVVGGVSQNPSLAAERGLLFMCFQRNIEKQFAFIQRTWADNPNFPLLSNAGDDPVIGQDPDETQRWPKVWGNRAAGRKDFNFESAVTLKGGEYFFAPSKVFLQTV